MENKKYTIGVIGPGVIWDKAHWPALQSMKDRVQVKYVYDVNPDLTRKAAQETGARTLETADAMFDDPEVEIVSICTPPFARVEYVEKACAAGKHLMLEKPMARTLEDALRIVQAIQKYNAKCFVPFGRGIMTHWRGVVAVIRSGEIGEPIAFCHTSLATPYPWLPLNHWMHMQSKSGGPIFDFSIHYLEMARECMGAEAESVYYGSADTTRRVPGEDHAVMLVNYQGGGFGEFSKSWNLPPGIQFGQDTNLIICKSGVISFGFFTAEVHSLQGKRQLEVQMDFNAGRVDSYQNLIDAIEKDTPLLSNEINGLRTNEILDAALRSRETGRKEEVKLHF